LIFRVLKGDKNTGLRRQKYRSKGDKNTGSNKYEGFASNQEKATKIQEKGDTNTCVVSPFSLYLNQGGDLLARRKGSEL
jgi:hypothetical protein